MTTTLNTTHNKHREGREIKAPPQDMISAMLKRGSDGLSIDKRQIKNFDGGSKDSEAYTEEETVFKMVQPHEDVHSFNSDLQNGYE